jgi:hypothetical protein
MKTRRRERRVDWDRTGPVRRTGPTLTSPQIYSDPCNLCNPWLKIPIVQETRNRSGLPADYMDSHGCREFNPCNPWLKNIPIPGGNQETIRFNHGLHGCTRMKTRRRERRRSNELAIRWRRDALVGWIGSNAARSENGPYRTYSIRVYPCPSVVKKSSDSWLPGFLLKTTFPDLKICFANA